MKRLLWWISGNIVVLAILFGAAWLWFKPAGLGPFGSDRTLLALSGPQHVTVHYKPGKHEAWVSVRLDGIGSSPEASFKVVSSEAWAPQWHATMSGQLSEFLVLHDGSSQSPEPMTRELAEQLARSYSVTLQLQSGEYKYDFDRADISEVRPLFSITR